MKALLLTALATVIVLALITNRRSHRPVVHPTIAATFERTITPQALSPRPSPDQSAPAEVHTPKTPPTLNTLDERVQGNTSQELAVDFYRSQKRVKRLKLTEKANSQTLTPLEDSHLRAELRRQAVISFELVRRKLQTIKERHL